MIIKVSSQLFKVLFGGILQPFCWSICKIFEEDNGRNNDEDKKSETRKIIFYVIKYIAALPGGVGPVSRERRLYK